MNLPFQIEHAINKVFAQLAGALSHLSNDDYKTPLEVLSGSTIGQHARHIIEFFVVLIDQYDDGNINYDKRERNHLLENEKEAALNEISAIQAEILMDDKEMTLTGLYAGDSKEITVITTYHRELIYNLEHAVHHMAMIKIGFRHITSSPLPSEFGVAASTTAYKRSVL